MIDQLGVFLDFGAPTDPARWVDLCCELGVTDACVGLDHSDDGVLQLHADPDKVVVLSEALQDEGIACHLMSWPTPNRADIRDSVTRIVPLCEASNAASWLLDTEHGWQTDLDADGVEDCNHQEGSDLLRDMLENSGLVVGVTSYGFLPYQVRPLLSWCDYVLPQAYSIWVESKKYTHPKACAPGNLQRNAFYSWREQMVEGQGFIMGLANYSQKRPAWDGAPAMTELQAMTAAWDTTVHLGVRSAWYWSFKHMDGNQSWERSRRRFIAEKGEAIQDRLSAAESLPLDYARERLEDFSPDDY